MVKRGQRHRSNARISRSFRLFLFSFPPSLKTERKESTVLICLRSEKFFCRNDISVRRGHTQQNVQSFSSLNQPKKVSRRDMSAQRQRNQKERVTEKTTFLLFFSGKERKKPQLDFILLLLFPHILLLLFPHCPNGSHPLPPISPHSSFFNFYLPLLPLLSLFLAKKSGK